MPEQYPSPTTAAATPKRRISRRARRRVHARERRVRRSRPALPTPQAGW